LSSISVIVPFLSAAANALSSITSISAASSRKALSSDIVPIVLREAVDKERRGMAAEQDDAPEPTGHAFPLPSQALLDHTAAEIGIDQSSLGSSDGIPQDGIGNTLLGGESREGLSLEEPHPS
jgi:hypothetical protein